MRLKTSLWIFAAGNQLLLALIEYKSITVFGEAGDPLGVEYFWILLILNTWVLMAMNHIKSGAQDAKQKT